MLMTRYAIVTLALCFASILVGGTQVPLTEKNSFTGIEVDQKAIQGDPSLFNALPGRVGVVHFTNDVTGASDHTNLDALQALAKKYSSNDFVRVFAVYVYRETFAENEFDEIRKQMEGRGWNFPALAISQDKLPRGTTLPLAITIDASSLIEASSAQLGEAHSRAVKGALKRAQASYVSTPRAVTPQVQRVSNLIKEGNYGEAHILAARLQNQSRNGRQSSTDTSKLSEAQAKALKKYIEELERQLKESAPELFEDYNRDLAYLLALIENSFACRANTIRSLTTYDPTKALVEYSKLLDAFKGIEQASSLTQYIAELATAESTRTFLKLQREYADITSSVAKRALSEQGKSACIKKLGNLAERARGTRIARDARNFIDDLKSEASDKNDESKSASKESDFSLNLEGI